MATVSQPVKARVNRAFLMEGKVLDVGATITLPPALYSELYTANKVERADGEPSAAHLAALEAVKAKAQRKAGAGRPAKAS